MAAGGKDRALLWSLRAASAVAVSIVLLVIVFLVRESAPGLTQIGPLRFFSDSGWFPDQRPGEFNLVPMVVATLATTLLAVLIAAPVGLLAAVYCRFYAPAPLASGFRVVVQLLAGIPSVVYGLWGLTALVPWVRELGPPGPSLLAGSLVLAMMIVPTVTILAHAALESVPTSLLHGAASLGLSRWTTLWGVVLPATGHGLAIAVALGTLRAIGETMAVLMVCGNVARVPKSVLDPVRTLTANIALELGYATTEHRSVLFVSGLALMAMVVLLVGFRERLTRGARLA